jgi:hypothetical protein
VPCPYKSGWSICQAEQNDSPFIESFRSDERCFVAVFGVNTQLMVSACQVQFGKYTCAV